MSEEAPAGAPLFREIRSLPREKTYGYRSLGPFTYTAVALVGLNGLAVAGQVVSLAMRWQLLSKIAHQGFASQESLAQAAAFSDGLVGVTALAMVVTVVLAYIAGGFWIYNAACNVRALGARGLQTSPGWAVGWFAVPVMSLLRPFQAMEEIYQASMSPSAWRAQPTSWLLRGWWAAWLVAGFGGYLIFLFSSNLAASIPGLSVLTDLGIADAALDLVCVILFLMIVQRIGAAQTRSRAQLNDVAHVFA